MNLQLTYRKRTLRSHFILHRNDVLNRNSKLLCLNIQSGTGLFKRNMKWAWKALYLAIKCLLPGGNTPQGTNYTATCLPLRKLYKLDEPDTQDTAGEARTSSSVMYSYGPPHMAKQKRDDQLEHTYSSYERIRSVALKTCQKRWMIGRSGERGSGISVLAAWCWWWWWCL